MSTTYNWASSVAEKFDDDFVTKSATEFLKVCSLIKMVTWIALWRLEARSRHGASTETTGQVIFESVRKLFKALRMTWQILRKKYQKPSQTTLKINVMKIHSTTAGLVSIWKRNFPLKFVKTEWGIFSAHFAVSVHIWFRSLHHLIITRKRTPLFLISGRGTRYTFNTHLKSIALKKRS